MIPVVPWFLGLPSWVRKGAYYLAITLVVLYLVRWYGNRRATEGAREERLKIVRDYEEKMDESHRAAKAEIAKLSEANQTAIRELTVQISDLQAKVEKSRRDLAAGIASVRTEREVRSETVATIPASELDGELRKQSVRLSGAGPQ